MIQVTMTTDATLRVPLKEIGQYRSLDLAKEAAHEALAQHFRQDADLNFTIQQDTDYVDCFDWFVYDSANKVQDAVCVAINTLPLISTGVVSAKPVYEHSDMAELNAANDG